MSKMNFSEDPLVSQPELRRQLGGISDMTVWRWRLDGTLPNPIVINGRNYWRQSVINETPNRAASMKRGAGGRS